VGQQLDEDLRHGRQPRDQQAIADILVWLVYGLKHGATAVLDNRWRPSPAQAATLILLVVPGTGQCLRLCSEREKLILAYIHFWPGTTFSGESDVF
jgi:hypothetical protein